MGIFLRSVAVWNEFRWQMATKTKKKKKMVAAKDVGAPVSFLAVVLAGFPFLALLLAGVLWSAESSYVGVATYLCILVFGLCISFYWRRFKPSAMKSFAFGLYKLTNLGYAFSYVALSLSTVPEKDFIVPLSIFALLLCVFVGSLLSFSFGQNSPRKSRLALHFICSAILFVGASFFLSKFQNLQVGTDAGRGFLLSLEKSGLETIAELSEVNTSDGKVFEVGNEEDAALQLADNLVETDPLKIWNYHGNRGPEVWGSLDPAFVLCEQGLEQSPIELPAKVGKVSKALKFAYGKEGFVLKDNGRVLAIYPEESSRLKNRKKLYELEYIEFHSPSEHALGGMHFPLEIQIYHKSRKGETLAIAIMVKEGSHYRSINPLIEALSLDADLSMGTLLSQWSPRVFIPRKLTHHRYMGSKTTPPCSEGVNWYVLTQPIQMSKAQISVFKNYYIGNSRPLQKANSRPILGH